MSSSALYCAGPEGLAPGDVIEPPPEPLLAKRRAPIGFGQSSSVLLVSPSPFLALVTGALTRRKAVYSVECKGTVRRYSENASAAAKARVLAEWGGISEEARDAVTGFIALCGQRRRRTGETMRHVILALLAETPPSNDGWRDFGSWHKPFTTQRLRVRFPAELSDAFAEYARGGAPG